MISEELSRRLAELKQKAQDFLQMVNVIDGNFDSRLSEIKSLELKRDKLKAEVEETQRKANQILQDASDQAAQIARQAKSLMEDAQASRYESKAMKEEGEKMKAEGNALMIQAIQRQKEADAQYQMNEERRKKLLAAAQ